MPSYEIFLGITYVEGFNYPYCLIVKDEAVKSYQCKATALIALAAEIDKHIEATPLAE